ncbi:hypothetical protein ACMAZD_26020 (plasmid) [Vibrio sp. nBUS_14]
MARALVGFWKPANGEVRLGGGLICINMKVTGWGICSVICLRI